jgi:hypothetical protein
MIRFMYPCMYRYMYFGNLAIFGRILKDKSGFHLRATLSCSEKAEIAKARSFLYEYLDQDDEAAVAKPGGGGGDGGGGGSGVGECTTNFTHAVHAMTALLPTHPLHTQQCTHHKGVGAEPAISISLLPITCDSQLFPRGKRPGSPL